VHYQPAVCCSLPDSCRHRRIVAAALSDHLERRLFAA
jgi:hypothetical protein